MKRFLAIVLGGGLGLTAVLIIAVFATGQTFGQRCEAAGYTDEAHIACVSRLSMGGTP